MTKTESTPVRPLELTAATAFVVHLGADEGRVFGRVEHVASGGAIRFGSAAELIGFMCRTLAASSATTENP